MCQVESWASLVRPESLSSEEYARFVGEMEAPLSPGKVDELLLPPGRIFTMVYARTTDV